MKQAIRISTLVFCLALNSCETNSAPAIPPPLSDAEKAVLSKMGGELLPDGNIRLGKITIDRAAGEINFPAEMNITEGDLEVLISTPAGRTHESLLVSDIDAFGLQLALILAGAENGLRVKDGHLPQGTLMQIDVSPENGKREPVENWLFNKRTDRAMEKTGWVFVGSSFTHSGVCLANEEGNIVNTWSFGNTILDNPGETGNTDDYLATYTEKVPARGTKVTVYLKIMEK